MLFCEIHPICYEISLKKEICKRHIKDLLSDEKFAKEKSGRLLPNVVAGYSCNLIKRGKGVDLRLQENKAVNIRLACDRIDGLVIYPNEVFSFWHMVGKTTKEKGYKDCNLGNTIHYMVLHSPLKVTEFHHHSDALAPEEGKRVPFSTGTSISYNYIDYRFKNNTDQKIQLHVWCDAEKLYGELRSETEFPWRYSLVEEEKKKKKEGDRYFRVSKIFREIIERSTGDVINKELILDNHSEVMYDYDLIPKDMISE